MVDTCSRSALVALFAVAAFAAAGEAAQDGGAEALAGELLLAESQCLDCHDSGAQLRQRLRPRGAPRLEGVTRRVAADYLRAFLADPSATKPGTSMPRVLPEDPALAAPMVEDLLAYLALGSEPFDAVAHEIRAEEVERGERLFHRKGCAACHLPTAPAEQFDGELGPVPSHFDPHAVVAGSALGPLYEAGHVPLPEMDAKTSLAELTAFLLDPLVVRPSGRMPDLLLDAVEAKAIASYLFARGTADGGAAIAEELRPGLFYDYYEADMGSALPDFDALTPTRSGISDRVRIDVDRRGDHFAFRWRGSVNIPESGTWTFYTASDDGSRVFVDDVLVVDHDGLHGTSERSGTLELTAGIHSFTAMVFERDGGESMKVSFSGPGVEKRELGGDDVLRRTTVIANRAPGKPPAGDPARGEALFASLGCANCHEFGQGRVRPASTLAAPPLAQLAADSETGCLSASPAGGAPKFAHSAAQRAALKATLGRKSSLGAARDVHAQVHFSLAQLQCYACHERDGHGGPTELRARYFGSVGAVDMGTEGQLPPSLTGAGGKLRQDWLHDLLSGAARTRDFMETRMPYFGTDAVDGLAQALQEADLTTGWDVEPVVQEGWIEAGHQLAGTEGLACIECHSFGEFPSRGMPAGDLADMWRRLQPGWFRAWLEKPSTIRRGTRMPNFFTPGELSAPEVLHGDADAQIAALWTYLSLADSAPVPHGLVTDVGTYELVPLDRPLLVGVFMRNVSPRTLCVGFPERTHYAYDMRGQRLAKAWRGTFFNAKGTWAGRAGQLEEPPGDSVIDLPPGPAVALLEQPGADWPSAVPDARLLGRGMDAEGIPQLPHVVRWIRGDRDLPSPAARGRGGAPSPVRSPGRQSGTPSVRPGGSGRAHRGARGGVRDRRWRSARSSVCGRGRAHAGGFARIARSLRVRARSGRWPRRNGGGGAEMVIAALLLGLVGDGEELYYRIDTIPIPEGLVVEVGGMVTLGDDDFLACTRRGEVWRVREARARPEDPEFTLFAQGLQEPLGLLHHEGWIYCTQRGELTRMRDRDGDGAADEFETVCDLWPISGNYHEYNFGPVLGDDGYFWITTNKPFGAEPFGRADWRGFALRISADGEMLPTCSGLRSPAGVEKSPWGDIFYTDNQGEWCGASKMSHLEPGDFHGHPHGLFSCEREDSPLPHPGEIPNGELMPEVAQSIPGFKLPAVWFPYDKMGKSPAGMLWDVTEGAFGPFAGQVFVGDQHHSSVLRVFLERVNGHWQGACFPFRDGFQCGVLRMEWDGDSSMLVGMTNRGWGSRGNKEQGLQRLTWTGQLPFEVLEMRARSDGFELCFTQPLAEEAELDPTAYSMISYTYKLHSTYGSNEFDKQEIEVTSVERGADGRTLRLRCSLRPGYVHELKLPALSSDSGTSLLHEMAYYTLIEIPEAAPGQD